MESTKTTPVEALLEQLTGLVPDEVLEKVETLLWAQQEEIEEQRCDISRLKGEVSEFEEVRDNPSYGDLATQVGELTKEGKQKFLEQFLKEWSNEYAFLEYFKDEYPDLQFQDHHFYITLPYSYDGMASIQIEQLEEYITQHGVEDTLLKLQDTSHQQEVEDLKAKIWDLEDTVDSLRGDLHEAIYFPSNP